MSSLNLITAPASEPVQLAEAKTHLRVNVTDDDALISAQLTAARERVELETGRQLITAIWELWLGAFPGMQFGLDASLSGGWSPWSFGAGANAWLDWSFAIGHRFVDVPRPPLQFTRVGLTGATHATTTIDGIASTTGLLVGMTVTSPSGVDFAPGTTIAAVSTNSITLSQAALTSNAALALVASTVGITYVDTSGVTQTWDPSQYLVHAPSGPTAERGRITPAYGISWPVTRDQLDAVKIRFFAGYGTTPATVPQMLNRAILWMTGDFYENREGTVVTDRRVTVQPLPYGLDNILQQYRARPIARAA